MCGKWDQIPLGTSSHLPPRTLNPESRVAAGAGPEEVDPAPLDEDLDPSAFPMGELPAVEEGESPISDFWLLADEVPAAASAAERAPRRSESSRLGSNWRDVTRYGRPVAELVPRRIFCMPRTTVRSPGLTPVLISRYPLRKTPGLPTSTASG